MKKRKVIVPVPAAIELVAVLGHSDSEKAYQLLANQLSPALQFTVAIIPAWVIDNSTTEAKHYDEFDAPMSLKAL